MFEATKSFNDNGSKRTLRIRSIQLKLLKSIMRKEGPENLIYTRHTESKKSGKRQQNIYITILCKLIADQKPGKKIKIYC